MNVEKDKCRLTDWDIERCAYYKIRVSMDDYAKIVEEIREIRREDRNDKL